MFTRLLALALAAPVLVACSSTVDDYCGLVREHQHELTDLASRNDASALFEANEVYRDLADSAPRDVRDEWKIVVDAVDRLKTTVEDLGIDPAAYDPANPPADLSQAELDRLRAAAVELVDPKTQEAMDAVEQQARDVCETPLTL